MKEKKQEELQSRREFFKSAAKAALPVLGAVVMSSLPIVNTLATTQCNGCGGTCRTTCYGGCQNSCHGECVTGCTRGCRNVCNTTCKWGCKGGANGPL